MKPNDVETEKHRPSPVYRPLVQGALSWAVRGSLRSTRSQTATITRLREPGQTAGRSAREPEHLGLGGLSSRYLNSEQILWQSTSGRLEAQNPREQSAERKKEEVKEVRSDSAEQEGCFHSSVGCFKRPTVTSAALSLNKSEIRGQRSQAWSALSPWLPPPIPGLLRRSVLLDLRHTAVEVPGTLITF